jgi:acylphosphatase
VFEGSKDVVEKMIRWCHRGNQPALVKDVIVEYETPEGIQGYDIRR